MTWIVGYTDRSSVAPGGRIGCHVSLLADSAHAESRFQASFGRIVGIDAAGEERLELVDKPAVGHTVAKVETTSTGSYCLAHADFQPGPVTSLDIEATFMPTLFDGTEQSLISVQGPRGSITLGLDPSRRPLLIVDGGADQVRLVVDRCVAVHRWYRARGGFRGGEAFVTVVAIDDPGFPDSSERRSLPQVPALAEASICIAARHAFDPDAGTVSHFTGRIERPSVSASGVEVASWDFGLGHASASVRDTSGNENHGTLFGVPTRAVSGSLWDGKTTSFVRAPDQFRAIHFFADAIEDAGWPETFHLDLPDHLDSGLYGIRLECEEDHEVIPVVVSPRPGPDRAEILVVVPTATYMAYGNTRFPWEKVNYEVQQERTVELGRGERILLEHPEFGASSYDQHLDGADITQISWRRPNLDMRSTQSRGEAYPSDLMLIDWLDRRGYRYDVCTDDGLDRDGPDLLDSYRVVLTGTHPEYVTSGSAAALGKFISAGGRIAVLGGDVFTWYVGFDPERPWIMEVRKPDRRPVGTRQAAEYHLALTGEPGGKPGLQRPSEALLGMSTASMGFDAPRPYERLGDSDRGEVRFIFEGVEGRIVGDAISGGVVDQEWDNTGEVSQFARSDRLLVLARSSGHSLTTRWFGAGKRRNHAEMTYFTSDAGGGVFSVSSMAWCRHLGRDDVSAITANVIDRFLEPQPLERVDRSS